MSNNKRRLAVAALIILPGITLFTGYGLGRYEAAVDERNYLQRTLGCEPGLISGPCVEDAVKAERERCEGESR